MELGVELELGKNKYILKLAFKYLSGVFVNFVNVSGKAIIICGCGGGAVGPGWMPLYIRTQMYPQKQNGCLCLCTCTDQISNIIGMI